MKNIFFSLVLLLASASVFCQNSMGFRYQTVLRDLTRQVLVNESVTFRMSLLEGSPDGPALYAEKHSATTNQFGLVTFTIGQGDEPEGDFLEVPWGTTDVYLQVEIDPKGGNDFEVMGASLMLAVPIATWETSDEDRSPDNELQEILIDGGTVQLTLGGGFIHLPDSSATNEIQQITIVGGRVELSLGGGSLQLPDSSATNELQQIVKNGNIIELSQNGGSVELLDDDPYNEIQDPYIFGTELGLTGGNWTADLSAFMDSPWIELGSSQIYFPGHVAVGTSSFSNGSDFTVGGYMDVKGGSIDLLNSSGKDLLTLNQTSLGGGYFATFGSSSSYINKNFVVSSLLNYPNNGFAAVADQFDAYQAGMYVDDQGKGIIWGDVKSFRMEHPTKPGKEIWYACPEGPEAAAYERGIATLVNGEAFIPFSEHFEIVVNPTTMTVVLTPNDASSLGLAVVEKTATGIRVKELHSGTGNYAFDWQATAVRKGHEDFKVVRDAGELCPAPPAKRD